MLKHLCSAISYGGARSLPELQEMFRKEPERYVIRLTEPSRRESFESIGQPLITNHRDSETQSPGGPEGPPLRKPNTSVEARPSRRPRRT